MAHKFLFGLFSIIIMLSPLDTPQTPAATVTGYISLPSMDFCGGDEGHHVTSDCTTSVHLPHGATITKLSMYYKCTYPFDWTTTLSTYSYNSGAGGVVASVPGGCTDATKSPSVKVISATASFLVDNSNQGFYFYSPWRNLSYPPNETAAIIGVVIQYTLPSTLAAAQNTSKR